MNRNYVNSDRYWIDLKKNDFGETLDERFLYILCSDYERYDDLPASDEQKVDIKFYQERLDLLLKTKESQLEKLIQIHVNEIIKHRKLFYESVDLRYANRKYSTTNTLSSMILHPEVEKILMNGRLMNPSQHGITEQGQGQGRQRQGKIGTMEDVADAIRKKLAIKDDESLIGRDELYRQYYSELDLLKERQGKELRDFLIFYKREQEYFESCITKIKKSDEATSSNDNSTNNNILEIIKFRAEYNSRLGDKKTVSSSKPKVIFANLDSDQNYSSSIHKDGTNLTTECSTSDNFTPKSKVTFANFENSSSSIHKDGTNLSECSFDSNTIERPARGKDGTNLNKRSFDSNITECSTSDNFTPKSKVNFANLDSDQSSSSSIHKDGTNLNKRSFDSNTTECSTRGNFTPKSKVTFANLDSDQSSSSSGNFTPKSKATFANFDSDQSIHKDGTSLSNCSFDSNTIECPARGKDGTNLTTSDNFTPKSKVTFANLNSDQSTSSSIHKDGTNLSKRSFDSNTTECPTSGNFTPKSKVTFANLDSDQSSSSSIHKDGTSLSNCSFDSNAIECPARGKDGTNLNKRSFDSNNIECSTSGDFTPKSNDAIVNLDSDQSSFSSIHKDGTSLNKRSFDSSTIEHPTKGDYTPFGKSKKSRITFANLDSDQSSSSSIRKDDLTPVPTVSLSKDCNANRQESGTPPKTGSVDINKQQTPPLHPTPNIPDNTPSLSSPQPPTVNNNSNPVENNFLNNLNPGAIQILNMLGSTIKQDNINVDDVLTFAEKLFGRRSSQ